MLKSGTVSMGQLHLTPLTTDVMQLQKSWELQ